MDVEAIVYRNDVENGHVRLMEAGKAGDNISELFIF
jgi:hypothetical protein